LPLLPPRRRRFSPAPDAVLRGTAGAGLGGGGPTVQPRLPRPVGGVPAARRVARREHPARVEAGAAAGLWRGPRPQRSVDAGRLVPAGPAPRQRGARRDRGRHRPDPERPGGPGRPDPAAAHPAGPLVLRPLPRGGYRRRAGGRRWLAGPAAAAAAG